MGRLVHGHLFDKNRTRRVRPSKAVRRVRVVPLGRYKFGSPVTPNSNAFKPVRLAMPPRSPVEFEHITTKEVRPVNMFKCCTTSAGIETTTSFNAENLVEASIASRG